MRPTADSLGWVRTWKAILITVLAVVVAIAVTAAGALIAGKAETARDQAALDPFYTAPDPLPPGRPGDIIRSEPLTTAPVSNGNSYRVLYRTELPDGTPRVSGAMLFVPTTPPPPGGRKIVSWAHPTVGMGQKCAPSRTPDPLTSLTWLQEMLDRGWIVTATDYAGLGTAGIEYYLVAANEVIDTVNAVRMAQRFPDSHASSTYAVYGHSQGGHASLWAGEIGPKYAPELKLAGVAAAAPAAELVPLVDQQWNTSIGWVIGPEVFISWPATYPQLNPDQVASKPGLEKYQKVSQDCLLTAGAEGVLEVQFGQYLFSGNPLSNPKWRSAAIAQTTPVLPPSMPTLVIQSTNDGIVLPNTTAVLQQKWCKAGSKLQVDWLGPLRGNGISTHMYEGVIGGPLAASWIQQRFDGVPAPTNCGTEPAVAPYKAGG